MEEVIRRQQMDISVLVNENQRLREDLYNISQLCMNQAEVIRVIQSEKAQPIQNQGQKPVERRPHFNKDGRQIVFPRDNRRASPLLKQVWT
jgi:Tfp pilus assembly pilus retraction ATPase PilT